MTKPSSELTREIITRISDFKLQNEHTVEGRVISNTDGIVKASGLSQVAYMATVQFPGQRLGVAINLEEREVGILVLGDHLGIKTGDTVIATDSLLSLPVGPGYLGRVVNPLGEPLDGKGKITGPTHPQPLEKIAPSVTKRQPVDTSLATGIKAIDALVPIGRGQRELIIGDRGIGKTTLALDTIVNQKDQGVMCIYVAIGQKTARVAQIIDRLDHSGSLAHTIVVAANASDPASLQYLAPYTGVTLGEFFMAQGKDVLVIYDDLSKHAWSYRQISLLLKRPSGREAYPGDIFYLHSRLLERACRLSDDQGGGSLTALPIIETQSGDISAYIPTNVISITDGQIFLEPDLFYSGIRPAISVGLSVSRVGGNAQQPVTKQVAGRLRLDLAQYRELAAFAQFSSDLDAATKSQIEQGKRATEILKQPQGEPLPLADQIIPLWAVVHNHLADIPLEKISEFEIYLRSFARRQGKKLLTHISTGHKLTAELEQSLLTLVTDCKKEWLK